MALTSASSFADAEDQYQDSLRYDLGGGVAMCKDLIEAIRFMLQKAPEETASGQERIKESKEIWAAELDRAVGWLAVNDSSNQVAGGGVRYLGINSNR